MEKDLPAKKNEISEVFWKTYQALTEGMTGVLASDRKEVFLTIGYLFQRMRGGNFLKDLWETWDHFREKGKIKEDYATTEQCQASLQEILDCLDRDSPDEIRFSFLKKLFITIASEKLSNRDSFLPQQYMSIARSLTSGEIIVLLSTYRAART
jgi:hypothetical protein